MAKLERIYLFEDEADLQTITRYVLEHNGNFVVDVSQTGNDAERKVLEFAPDLILMDTMMPGVDGKAAFLSLKKNSKTRKIPVVFFTAKVQDNEVDHYFKLGAAGVINKPYDPETLVKQIQSIWVTRESSDLD